MNVVKIELDPRRRKTNQGPNGFLAFAWSAVHADASAYLKLLK